MRALAPMVAFATMLALAGSADARAEPPVRLRFNGYVDVPIAAGLSLIYAVSELGVKSRLAPRAPYWDDRDESGEDVLAPLDRMATRLRWEQPRLAGRISDGGLGLAMISAIGLISAAGANDNDTLAHLTENTTIVLESMSAAMSLNQITKFFAGRQRPCAHFGLDQARPCFSEGSDNNLSSFSGHAAFTSSLAVSSGMVASMRRYRLAPLVWASGATISLGTGYLRLAADKHYLSDVVTGLVIGSAIGFFVPYLFHGPRPTSDIAASPVTGAAASALREQPLFAFSGTW